MDNIALINENDKSRDSNSVSRKLGILCTCFVDDKVVTLTNGLFFDLTELSPDHWIYDRLSEYAKERLCSLQAVA